ncbi:transposase [Colwelliaceae bacterium BS250]
MSTPRKKQIFLSETPYYHCVSRCVRRAFLCGFDLITNQSYEHRRAWVEERLLFLTSIYTIDVCAFAVMSNHTHTVVKIDEQQAKNLTDKQVLERWHKLHYGTLLTRQFCRDEKFDDALLPTIKAIANVYRSRLSNLSWFMKDLNEYIARLANGEDGCTGRFWEGRFSSQALLDDASLLACMAYVDLNPIRAQMATNLTQSDHTSIQLRMKAAINNEQPHELLPFTGGESLEKNNGITFKVNDYIQLVEATGRCQKKGKHGYINDKEGFMLVSLGIGDDNWLAITQHFEDYFKGSVGNPNTLDQHMHSSKLKRRPNNSNSIKYLS